jgi:hypothetical protein
MITSTRNPEVMQNLIAVGLCRKFKATACDPWLIDYRNPTLMARSEVSNRESVSNYFSCWKVGETTFYILES